MLSSHIERRFQSPLFTYESRFSNKCRFIFVCLSILVAKAFSGIYGIQARDPLVLLLSIPFYSLLRVSFRRIDISSAFSLIAGLFLSSRYAYSAYLMYPDGFFTLDIILNFLGYTVVLCAAVQFIIHVIYICLIALKSRTFSVGKVIFTYFAPCAFSVFSFFALIFFYQKHFSAIMSVAVLLSFFCFFCKIDFQKESRIRLVSSIVGFIFASFYFWSDLVPRISGFSHIIRLVFLALGLYLIFSRTIFSIYVFLEGKNLVYESSSKGSTSRPRAGIVFLFSFVAISFVFYLWYLYDYPGCITNDSNWQLKQILGTSPLSNAHPLIHTLLVKVFFELGLLLHNGSQNGAVATYTVFQFLAMAAIFSYVVTVLYRMKVKKLAVLAVFLFFILVPYHGFYSVTIWKDTLFAGITLVLCAVLLQTQLSLEKSERLRIGEYLSLFVISLLFCLLRGNAFYAYILFAPCLFFFAIKKDRTTALLPFAVLLAAVLIKGPLFTHLGIAPSDIMESLSIPTQHISRAITDGAELSDEQYSLLSEVIDVDSISTAYDPTLSDPIKILVWEKNNQDFIAENKFQFLKLWFDLGLDNPVSYFNAQIDQTLGYWYPPLVNWVISEDSFMSSSGLETFPDRRLPESLCPLFNYLRNYYPWSLSFLGIFCSLGTAFWAYIFLMGMCIINRRYSYLIIYLPVVFLVFSLFIATPVHAEFRYVYSLFTTLPLMFVLPFYKRS